MDPIEQYRASLKESIAECIPGRYIYKEEESVRFGLEQALISFNVYFPELKENDTKTP